MFSVVLHGDNLILNADHNPFGLHEQFTSDKPAVQRFSVDIGLADLVMMASMEFLAGP